MTEPTPFEIRPGQHADALAIATVHVQTWQSHYRGTIPDVFLDKLSIDERHEHWQRWLAAAKRGNQAVFVATIDQTICGFLSGGPCRDIPDVDGELYAVYIQPARQGNGIGKALVDAFFDWLRQHGYKQVMCWVLAQNERSRQFYERLGGTLCEQRKTCCFALVDLELVAYRWQL